MRSRVPRQDVREGSSDCEQEEGWPTLHRMRERNTGVTLRIVAPHFVAAVVVGVQAAPIVKYMLGWSEARIREYCFWKGWEVEKVNDE